MSNKYGAVALAEPFIDDSVRRDLEQKYRLFIGEDVPKDYDVLAWALEDLDISSRTANPRTRAL